MTSTGNQDRKNVAVKIRRVPVFRESVWVRANASELSLHRDLWGFRRLTVILSGYNEICLPQAELSKDQYMSTNGVVNNAVRSDNRALLAIAMIAASPACCTLILMLCTWWHDGDQLDLPAFSTWMWLTWGWKLCGYSDMYLLAGAGLLLSRSSAHIVSRLQDFLALMGFLLICTFCISACLREMMGRRLVTSIRAPLGEQVRRNLDMDVARNDHSIPLLHRRSTDIAEA